MKLIYFNVKLILNTFAGINIKSDRKDEVIDMCKAWDDMIQDTDLNIGVAAKKINMTVDEFTKEMEAVNYKVPKLV